MAGRVLPRYLILVSTLTLVGIGFMLTIFYGQYRWLTSGIVASSVEQHGDSLAESFERQSRGQLYRASIDLAETDLTDPLELQRILDRVIETSDTMTGVVYTFPNGDVLSTGAAIEAPVGDDIGWRSDSLFMRVPVTVSGESTGYLVGLFALDTLISQTEAFEERLVALGTESRKVSFIWIGLATAVTLALCALVIWTIARLQAQRIRELKVQAEKLSDADYGEPLRVIHGDMLGDLATVFNDMRDKLKRTTVSRNYVDSVLSSMNEAIIVTSEEGNITRVNEATTRMLGYGGSELVGQHVDLIVDTSKGRQLKTNTSSSVPHEAALIARSGELIPISYTGSTIEAEGDFCGHRIFAAQNITERRKAEKRIRYLARIDALTKVPNRMQFQHLLQRAIARAKKQQKSIALFYIDIDFFKEINDTFGHLAGDATLETVAERLTNALPRNTVVGRLAGDEFAVIVDKIDANTSRVTKSS
jgi:PAS domain S-box-containing protein